MLLLLLLFLVLLSPSVFAAVDCYQVGVDTWVCYQTSPSGGDDPSGSPVVITNVLGVCTNCVAMLPDECSSVKQFLLSDLDRLGMYLHDQTQPVIDLMCAVEDFADTYNTMVEPGLGSSGQWVGSSSSRPDLDELRMIYGDLADDVAAGNKVGSVSAARGAYYGGIYTFYNDKVKPLLDSTSTELHVIATDIEAKVEDVYSLYSFVDASINCSECQSSLPEGTPPSITLPPGGSGSSSGCPCKEQIEGLKNVSVSIETSVNDAVEVLKRIETMIRNISISQRDLVSGVSNLNSTVSRIDDYVQDDLSRCIKEIQNTFSNYVKVVESSLISSVVSNTTALADLSVSLSASNLVSVFTAAVSNEWREPYISLDYSNQAYRVISNTDHSLLDTGDGFQFGLFATNYTWFSRVEYLLMRSAGLFDTIGSTNTEFTSSEQDEIDKVDEDEWKVDGLKSLLVNNLNTLKEKKTLFKPFEGVFAVSREDVRSKITLLPDVSLGDAASDCVHGSTNVSSSSSSGFISLIGSTFPAIEIDLDEKGDGEFSLMDFVDLSHSVFRWIWYLLGFLLLFGMIVFYVRIILVLLAWWHKITRAWASNLIDDKGFR